MPVPVLACAPRSVPPSEGSLPCPVDHPSLREWIAGMAALCRPERACWCDGSEEEREHLIARAVAEGLLATLDRRDMARAEERAFFCTRTRQEAGAANWMDPDAMYHRLYSLCDGAMRGRTMYIVPYLAASALPPVRAGVLLTDSLHVVLSVRNAARTGRIAWRRLGAGGSFHRALHCRLDLDPENRFIAHFPQDNAVISTGPGFGGSRRVLDWIAGRGRGGTLLSRL